MLIVDRIMSIIHETQFSFVPQKHLFPCTNEERKRSIHIKKSWVGAIVLVDNAWESWNSKTETVFSGRDCR